MKHLEQSKGDFIKTVLSHRKKFSNDDGELRSNFLLKVLLRYGKKLNQVRLAYIPMISRQEYDHIMAMLSRPDLRNIWNYKLVECIPQQTNQPGVYSTRKKPMMELYAYGPVKEEEVSKKFDEQGQPIANPVTTRLQIGEFHWNWKG